MRQRGALTDVAEVAVGSPLGAVPAFQGAGLQEEEETRTDDLPLKWRSAAAPRRRQPYLVGEGAIQVAGDGGDDVALGHGVVAGVGEALAAGNAAALALVAVGDAGPHRRGAAAAL